MLNNKRVIKKTALAIAFSAALGAYSIAFSTPVAPAVSLGANQLSVSSPAGDTLVKLVLRVALPTGKAVERISTSGDVSLDVSAMPDGSYRYETWSVKSTAEGKYTTGTNRGEFEVINGNIVQPAAQKSSGTEDTSFLDDLLQKGQDVAQSVSISTLDFLFPVAEAADLITSDPTPQVIFRDTTNDGTFNDWIIEGADGGSGFFRIIDDINDSSFNNKTVLSIAHPSASNSTENSIVVDNGGNVQLANGGYYFGRLLSGKMGIGTTVPLQGIHAKYAGAPATSSHATTQGLVRMEDTNNSTWDFGQVFVGTNNAGNGDFRINIANNGNSGTSGTKLAIKDENGNVGIGTTDPQAKLDVKGAIHANFNGSGGGLQQLFRMSANNTNNANRSDVGFVLENKRDNFSWAFRTEEDYEGFTASKQNTGAREFTLRNNTNSAANVELHLANGARNVGGQWLNASSRSYKRNIHELSSEDAMKALRGLKSVTYEFKRDKDHQQRVGFIAEDVPEMLATKDRKTVDPLQIVSVLTKAVQHQEDTLRTKDRKIAIMEAKINHLDKMKTRLDKLEGILKNLSLNNLNGIAK